MKLNWKKEVPTEEGWYFWKRSVSVKDPWKWNSYYLEENRDNRYTHTDGEGNPVKFWLWEAGADVYFPNGGHWAKIDIGEEDATTSTD